MIHQLKIDRHDYGRRGITVCPQWRITAVFIAWIEEEHRPRASTGTPAMPVYTFSKYPEIV
jgi:hypothetical protein